MASRGVSPRTPHATRSDDCNATTNVGTDHWLVYASAGASFATTSTNWTLPAFGAYAFTSTLGVNCPTYTVADANGDGVADLVVTNDCRSNTNVGTSLWNVYPGKCGSP